MQFIKFENTQNFNAFMNKIKDLRWPIPGNTFTQ